MKHTPGPWTVWGYKDGQYKIEQAQDQLDPENEDRDLSPEEAKEIDDGNCQLITAALPMLAALELCERALADYGDRQLCGIKFDACVAARKAIKTAKGE